MRKIWAATLCAASVVLLTGNGAEAQVQVDGFFDGIDVNGVLGPPGTSFSFDPGLATAQFNIVLSFDPSLGGILTTGSTFNGGTFQTLTWTTADGGTDPFESATLTVSGISQQFIPGSPVGVVPVVPSSFTPFVSESMTYVLSDATSFTISRGGPTSGESDAFYVSVVTPNGSFQAEVANSSATPEDASLSNPYSFTGFEGGLINLPDFPEMTSAPVLNVNFEGTGPLPVPEPSTWALLMLGFFGLGAALRRQNGRARATKLEYDGT